MYFTCSSKIVKVLIFYPGYLNLRNSMFQQFIIIRNIFKNIKMLTPSFQMAYFSIPNQNNLTMG